MRFIVAIVVLLSMLAGCARVSVQKVPLQCRMQHKDTNIKGFRYYLSRPYIIVKKAILVSEEIEHVLVAKEERMAGQAAVADQPSPMVASYQIIDGERAGAVIPHSDLGTRVTKHAGTSRLSEEESDGLRQLIANNAREDLQIADMYSAAEKDVSSVADTVSSGAGEHLGALDPKTTARDDTSTAALTGDLQIVFLPDMDEQYAVHNKSILAKSSFRFHFKDGWELTDVGGEYDSTTVTIELLNLVDTAVNSAKSIGLAKIDRAAAIAKTPSAADVGAVRLSDQEHQILQLVHSTYLRPGIYRLNKPWEIESEEPVGQELLMQLGMEMVTFTHIREPASLASLAEATAVERTSETTPGPLSTNQRELQRGQSRMIDAPGSR